MSTKNSNHIFWKDIDGVYDPVTGSYVFGDQTGNARGFQALDIQTIRAAATEVASGKNAIAQGSNSTASGDYSIAIGTAFPGYPTTASGKGSLAIGGGTASGKYAIALSGTASGDSSVNLGGYKATQKAALASGYGCQAINTYATAIGSNSTASGNTSFAFGFLAQAIGDFTVALGQRPACRIPNTTNICGPIINRKDNSEGVSANFVNFGGVDVVLESTERDLTTTFSELFSIPAGCHFFPEEVGVHVTSANTVTVQPSMRFGNSGNHAALLAITSGTGLTAPFACDRFQTLATNAGQTDLIAEITTGAVATALKGRFYFKGRLVEDQ